VLEAAHLGAGKRVLVESGPTATTRFLAEGAVDELFLTWAPSFIGRAREHATLGLLEGCFFGPGVLRGRQLSARVAGGLSVPPLRDRLIRPADLACG